MDKLKDCLSALEPGVAPVQKPAAYRPAVTARKKAIEQNHLILAFPSPTYLDPRRRQLQLLNALLGGGCSSRLFQEVPGEARPVLYRLLLCGRPPGYRASWHLYRRWKRAGAPGPGHGPGRSGAAAPGGAVPGRSLTGPVSRPRPISWMGAESIQARMSHLGASALLYGRVQETEEIISLYDSATRAQLRDLAVRSSTGTWPPCPL